MSNPSREGGLPAPIRTFIRRYLKSIEQLEVLVLRGRSEPRTWTASTIGEELGLPLHVVETVRRKSNKSTAEVTQAPKGSVAARSLVKIHSVRRPHRRALGSMSWHKPARSSSWLPGIRGVCVKHRARWNGGFPKPPSPGHPRRHRGNDCRGQAEQRSELGLLQRRTGWKRGRGEEQGYGETNRGGQADDEQVALKQTGWKAQTA